MSASEDITNLNGCAPNHRAPKHMKQKVTEMKGIESCTIIDGDFSTPL